MLSSVIILVFKYNVFQIFHLTALTLQGSNTPHCHLFEELDRVYNPATDSTSTIACEQDHTSPSGGFPLILSSVCKILQLDRMVITVIAQPLNPEIVFASVDMLLLLLT